MQQIQEDVNAIKTLHDSNDISDSSQKNPIQALVLNIPDSTLDEMEHWRPDPALNLMTTNPERYKELLAEGEKVMPKYNRELSTAIGLDKEEDTTAGEC